MRSRANPQVASPIPIPQAGRARALGILVSVTAITAVVAWAISQPAPTLPSSGAEIGAAGAALALYASSTLLRGERWRQLLRHLDATPTRLDSYALTLVGYMANNLLPARGGDLLRAVLIAPRANTGVRTSISTVVAERVLDAAVLGGLFAFLAYVVLRGIDAPDLEAAVIGVTAVAALLVIGLGTVVLAGRRLRLARRALEFLYPLAASVRELWGRAGLMMLLMTVVIWALDSGAVLAIGLSVGHGMAPVEALYVVAVAGIFLTVPAGPAQIGTFDAGVLFGARAIGMGGGTAVSFVLMARFVFFVPMTIAGLLAFVIRYRGSLTLARTHGGTSP